MKKVINKKVFDTETATLLGKKIEGEFGESCGYEENLFITKTKQHFIYGNGGPESKFTEPTIELVTDEQAEAWLKENAE